MPLLLSSIEKRLNQSLLLEYNLELQKGMNILFGKSGAGKTSTLKLILGYLTPEKGVIQFNGKTLFDASNKLTVPIYKRRIGFVPQNSLLFPHKTVSQNIAYGAASRSIVDELSERFRITHLVDRFPHQLSGGEQQRVAMLRALASDPDMLLFDEPLASLDADTKNLYLQEIHKLKEAYHFPMIYVTHNIAEALSVGDYVYVLDHGKIIQEGVPVEVFSKPTSQSLSKLLGTENILKCEVIASNKSDGVTIVRNNNITLEIHSVEAEIGSAINIAIRAEDIIISKHELKTSARNVVEAVVKKLPSSDYNELIADADGTFFRIKITSKSIAELGIKENSKIFLLIKAWSCYVLN